MIGLEIADGVVFEKKEWRMRVTRIKSFLTWVQ